MSMVVEKVRGLASAIISRIQEPRAIDYLGSALGGYVFTKWNVEKSEQERTINIKNPLGLTRLAALGGLLVVSEMFDFPGVRGFTMGAIGSTVTIAQILKEATGEYPSPIGGKSVFSIGRGEARAALPPGFRREWLRVVSK